MSTLALAYANVRILRPRSSLDEDLALERDAVRELETRVDAAWRRGDYDDARRLQTLLDAARAYVARLEGERP